MYLDSRGVYDAGKMPVDGRSCCRGCVSLLAARHVGSHDHDARRTRGEGLQVGGGGDAARTAQQDDAAGAGLHHPAGEEEAEAAAAAGDDISRCRI